MSDINEIKERIRSLLAKATDAGATAEEAHTAMQFARKLMAKYQLDEAAVTAARDGDFRTDTWHYTKDSKGAVIVHPIDRYCSVRVGRFCGVKPYISQSGDMAVFGFDSDVELFRWMMAAFKKHAEEDWQRFKVFQLGTKRLLDIKDARKSFMHGFAKAVNARLDDWLYRAEYTGDKAEETANALVIRKLSIVEQKMADMGINLGPTSRKGSMGGNTSAAGAGFNSGNSANVGRGMGKSYIAIGSR